MRAVRLVIVCAVALTWSVATPAAQDEQAAVLAVVKQVFDGMRTRDAAMIRGAFHPSAQLFSSGVREGRPDITVMSLDAFVAAATRPRPEVSDERTRNEIVHIDGAFASVWAEYAFYRGTTFSHCGVDAFHLAKDAGGWKIVALGDTRRKEGCESWPR